MQIMKPTTSTSTVTIEGINQHTILPLTFFTIGVLANDETVTLQYWDGYAWRNANIEGNLGVILNKDTALRSLYGNLSTFSKNDNYYKSNMRIVKTSTATPVGVGLSVRGA